MKPILGLQYLTPEETRKEKHLVSQFYREEGGSPIVESGVAAAIVDEALRQKFDARIVEVGVGGGTTLHALAQKGYRNISGVDLDDYVFPEYRAGSRLDLVDVSNERLPFGDAALDCVYAFETMEHLENPYHFIREAHRVLAPGGLFIVSMPNVQHLFNRIFFLRKGDMPRWRKNNGHLWVAPRGVFAKSFLRNFDLIKRGFYWGFFPWRFLSKLNIWPETELFAHTAWWVFKKK